MYEPEFFRNSQKCYLRAECDSTITKCYEYQMFQHNRINSFLKFQERNVNGQNYLYYEVSGMQSLDIYLQTRKLQRAFALKLVKAIQKLCNELSEYALQIECVHFAPKYIMVDSSEDSICFLYTFRPEENSHITMEKLLEGCIENLNYQDELLTEKVYGIYEDLLSQGDKFSLKNEIDKVAEVLEANEKSEAEEIVIKEYDRPIPDIQPISKAAQKEYKSLKRGIYGILLLDILMLVLWKPLTLLKIFLALAIGLVFGFLSIYIRYHEKKEQKKIKEKHQEVLYMEEYEKIADCVEDDTSTTQYISLENTEGVLYNLKEEEPICIYINETGQIIGKDKEKSQIHIEKKSISRIHAFVVKKGNDCFVEDLNSTNGTRVNGTVITPRTRCLLKPGDKVCFAEQEYIFR